MTESSQAQVQIDARQTLLDGSHGLCAAPVATSDADASMQ
jgi:hypothetical protein